ncbi:MAG: yjiA 1 [Firmicutes bacterium]|nr:yjiA 1 [Bacillota bacterium]
MNILLFGGFLGSGKTTTIMQVARQITEERQETVAIIENEIGEVGVDDKLLKGCGIVVKPLFGGCVCCQITSDLITAVNEIRETINPGWLIIEMTGLAVPGKVAETIKKYSTGADKIKNITLVDASRWAELREVLGPLIESQVEKSDVVIMNKVDIAGKDLDAKLQEVKEIAGAVPILVCNVNEKVPALLYREVFNLA